MRIPVHDVPAELIGVSDELQASLLAHLLKESMHCLPDVLRFLQSGPGPVIPLPVIEKEFTRLTLWPHRGRVVNLAQDATDLKTDLPHNHSYLEPAEATLTLHQCLQLSNRRRDLTVRIAEGIVLPNARGSIFIQHQPTDKLLLACRLQVDHVVVLPLVEGCIVVVEPNPTSRKPNLCIFAHRPYERFEVSPPKVPTTIREVWFLLILLQRQRGGYQ